jgi:flagella basal body P-ring formation protein FlgA
MMLLAAMAVSACLAVEGDKIVAADLAKAVPAFAAIDAGEELGYAPSPGARRILGPGELIRLAARHGVKLETAPRLCVERASEPLTEKRILEALKATLGGGEAHIEVLEFSHYPVPRGELEFPRTGYTRPAGGARMAVLWRGRLRYSEHRSVPVWARVRIWVTGKRLVAIENLEAGRPIQASEVSVETAELPPFANTAAESVEQVVGKLPRRTIRAGQPVEAGMLETPPAVERGDTVNVAVSSGAAQLSFQALAESSGRTGDTILLRNPESGRRFKGRIESRGKVVVDAVQNSALGARMPAGHRRLGR